MSPSSKQNEPKGFYFEDYLQQVGVFGKYQIAFALLTLLACLSLAGVAQLMTLAILEPEIECQRFEANSSILIKTNDTCSHCNRVSLKTKYFYSVAQEWKLVCSNSYIPNLMGSIHMAGQELGAPIGGHIADHFGRKPTLLGFALVMITFHVACVLSTDWITFITLRFISSIGTSICIVTLLVWGMEITVSKYNMAMTLASLWPLGYLTFTLVAMYFPAWKAYVMITGCFGVMIWPLFLFFKESPRWLVQMGKYEEAAKSLAQIHTWNKFGGDNEKWEIDQSDLKHVHLADHNVAGCKSFLDLFKHKTYAKYTIVLSLLVFIAALNNIIFLYNLNGLGVNPFYNMIGYAVLRLIIGPLPLYILDRYCPCFGRRALYAMGLSLVLSGSSVIIVRYLWFPGKAITDVLAALTAGFSSFLWAASSLFIVELYPSVIRSIATSTTGFIGGVGAVIGPQLIFLGIKYWQPLPYCVLVLLCVTAISVGLSVLPETKGKPFCEELEEDEEIEGDGEQRN